jgi:hypothetical protein
VFKLSQTLSEYLKNINVFRYLVYVILSFSVIMPEVTSMQTSKYFHIVLLNVRSTINKLNDSIVKMYQQQLYKPTVNINYCIKLSFLLKIKEKGGAWFHHGLKAALL